MSIEIQVTHQRWFEGPLSFKVCDSPRKEFMCPNDKPHGHFWGHGEVPVTLFPIITSKTLALEILFDLGDLLTSNALVHHPGIEKVKEEIAACTLPNEEDAE